MKNRLDRLKVSNAMSDLLSAEMHLGKLRITDDLSVEDFIELCNIKIRVECCRKNLLAMMKKGNEQ